jgi:hypothetical protein
MATGRPLVPLTLSWKHREQLQTWSRRAKTAQALAMRSRIVLLAADGLSKPRSRAGQDARWMDLVKLAERLRGAADT